MGIYTIHLAGESFGDRQKNILHASEGQKVFLIRDPKNPYSPDGTATLVTLADGKELGYIGQKNSSWISKVIDSKKPIEARIKSITGGYAERQMRGIILEITTGEDVQTPYHHFDQPTFSPSQIKRFVKLIWILIGLVGLLIFILLIS